jgi:hypothetical protein
MQAGLESLPFFRFGRDPNCDPEMAHTIVEMIDHVGDQFADPAWYWTDFQKSIDRKRKWGYRAKVDPSKLEEAWHLLCRCERLSLQNTNATKKISTILPLQGLTQLRSLVLAGNLIEDIGVLAGFGELRELYLTDNRVRDLSPLLPCCELKELHLGENPITDFRVLEGLPKLAELSLSSEQAGSLSGCALLPALKDLDIRGDKRMKNLTGFPQMPKMVSFRAEPLAGLEGIERWTCLQNLNVSGVSASLVPVSTLKGLTHIRCDSAKPIDAQPLSLLWALRKIEFHAPQVTGLRGLTSLPTLHEVEMSNAPWRTGASRFGPPKHDACELNAVVESLSPWDVEFLADAPRTTPAFNLVTVSEPEFECFNGGEPFGMKPGEENEAMVASEREWLVNHMAQALRVDLQEQEDFLFPEQYFFARSQTLVAYSRKAYERSRWVISSVQRVLCEARNDWIVYYQSLLGKDQTRMISPQEPRISLFGFFQTGL